MGTTGNTGRTLSDGAGPLVDAHDTTTVLKDEGEGVCGNVGPADCWSLYANRVQHYEAAEVMSPIKRSVDMRPYRISSFAAAKALQEKIQPVPIVRAL